MIRLLPDALRELWKSVENGEISAEEFHSRQDLMVVPHRTRWEDALLLQGEKDLKTSILSEIGLYRGEKDLSEIESKCLSALSSVKSEWQSSVDPGSRKSVEKFYDESEAMVYELMWWHTLSEDTSPLAYVNVLDFARQKGCVSYLDFGSGVGSGGILFAREGFHVTLADISSSMLDFCRWRLELRDLAGRCIDLKAEPLPAQAYDIVAAMDVFEHLVDAEAAVRDLFHAMKPGGYLFGRFHSEVDEDRPQHIVQDFGPTMQCLQSLGFVEVWRDEWLWGHQVFQKR